MIEVAGKDVVKTVEVTKTADKEVASKTVDIGKRVEIGSQNVESEDKDVDISKRVPVDGLNDKNEITNKDLNEVTRDYINDLKTKSEYPDTIADDCIDVSKLERQSPEKVAELRDEFDDNRANLRKEWEQLTGKEWPKYKEDVDTPYGRRKAGDNYDAHHIQPLCLGGQNVASNITPLDLGNHREIHLSDGSCKKLVDTVGGTAKV